MPSIRQRLALCAFLALAIPLAATAAPINVDSVQDPNTLLDGIGGGCTLRKALSNAVAGGQPFTDCATGSAGADVITFSSAAAITMGTIGAFPDINKDITLTGPKTITGNGSDTIFRIATAGTLRLTGFTLTGAGNSAIMMAGSAHLSVNGSAFNNNTTGACCGGAIGGDGTISLTDVSFDSNTAPSGSGGAIHLNGKDLSTISGVSSFSNNSAGQDGGAIYVSLTGTLVSPANLTITSAVFTGNKASASGGATMGGGAIHALASGVAFVSLFDTTFILNEIDGNDGRGGAIHNAKSDAYPMIVDHAKFLSNRLTSNANAVGGAIYTADNIVVRASSFILNDAGAGKGGAIASSASPPDNIPTPPEPGAVIANSTIQGNTAAIGGGIYNFGSSGNRELKLINVTLDGNTATGQGGGIFTENIGGGTAITRLANTIVSNNGGGNCAHVGNPIGNPVNNIVGNLQFPGATCLADSAITTGDPKLDPPFINPPDLLTVTMKLQAGSAASSAGDNAVCSDLAGPIFNLDQRSFLVTIRPAGGPNCDIGAYESSNAPGYGSVPAPGATITINTFSGTPANSTVVISEIGSDNLTITSYSVGGSPQVTVSPPSAPFTIVDGGGTQTLTLTCDSAAPGTFPGMLTVNHNAGGSPATYTVSCIVVDPLVITTVSPLASHTVNVAGYSQTLAATGGTAPYVNWVATVPAQLPPGLSINPATGAITGTPTAAGVFNFTAQVNDSAAAPLTATKAFSITINAAALVITTATPMPAGTVGVAYNQTFAATGGTAPYVNWAVTVGTLPPPLVLDAATGALTGTPTTAGPYSFTVQVTDTNGITATKAFTLTVNAAALVITTATPMPAGTVGVAYNQTFAATGGTVPYVNWAVTVGTLPPLLTLNPATGALTGTPTTAGPYSFTVQVTDTNGITATKAFTLTVNAAALVITTATPMPAGTVGVAYNQTFAATGGTAPYVNWAVTVGTLPPPLVLNPATGALTGTPTTAGPYSFTVQVTDTNGITATKAFTLTVNAAALVITTATPMPAGTVGVAYNQTFAATGGTAPYVNWAVTVGTLPPPLVLNPATGALTGTPTTAGPYSFTVQVTDTNGITATKAFTLTVNAAALVITTATPMPAGTVGVAYSQTFAATGGTAPYVNWAVTVGTLPPPLVLNPATGALTGTPTTAGPYSFTVQVTDTNGITATKAFTLTVNAAALVITTATPMPAGTVGVAYNQTFAATGGTAPYVNWAVTVGTLPPPLVLNPATGALTGTPTTAGPYSFTVQVTDTNGITATKAFTLTVNAAALVITTATPLPSGTVGLAYSQTFAATGGTAPYVNWAVTVGALPPGLSLNAGTGALTGPPGTAVGSPFSFTIQVTDTNGITATKAFTLPVNASLTITTATPMPAGTVGVAYSQTFAATGGTAPYVNWAVTAGTLPPGLSLNAGTGALTGPPGTAVGSPFSFTIQVTDNVGGTATKAFTLTVNAAALVITTATPLPSGTVGLAYSQTFAATGGTAPYVNWAVTVGALPPGLSLNAGTGALTGPPGTAVGSPFSFTIQVTDTNGITATKAFTLPVNASLTITTATPMPAGTVGVAYSQTFAATGGTAPYVNWAVTVGALPAGLTLNAATGALTGTPTTAVGSPFSFTIQVTDNVGGTATKAFSLTINPGPLTIITASPLPAGTVGTAYSQTLAAAGGTSPYSAWTVTVGSLPPGLVLAAATGALTGTPTTPGVYNFTVQVGDSAGVPATTTKAFALTIGGTALSITTATPLPAGTVGTAYSQLFAAAGGTPPYVSWIALVPAQLPAGPTLNAGSGLLTGTPTTQGTYTFTIQVTDSIGATATKAFTLTIGGGCFTGLAPTGAGNVTGCLSGGGPTCGFTPGTAQHIPLSGGPGSPPAGTAPAGIAFPYGLFTFTLSSCTVGSSVTMTLTYPAALPAGTQYWKYGPTPSSATPTWYVLPATIVGNTATFTIADGGLGDDDLVANGSIVDQGGPGVPAGVGAAVIQTPTLSEWAMLLLALLMLGIGAARTRRRA